jgi:predicted alpha/beta-hydrolase family hydrolase
MSEELIVTLEGGGETPALRYAAQDPRAPVLVLAHGAGAGQRSPFMTAFCDAMQTRGVTAVTFDFPYMRDRRRVPDRPPVLEAAWRAVLEHLTSGGAAGRVVIGGKSMGGRIASQVLSVAAQPLPDVAGLVLLGYPLHPPGQPDRPRTAHLPLLATPTLVVQGAHDAFGAEQEVREAFAAVRAPVDWLIIPGGDHSFKVRRGGPSQADVFQDVYETVAGWVHRRSSTDAAAPVRRD